MSIGRLDGATRGVKLGGAGFCLGAGGETTAPVEGFEPLQADKITAAAREPTLLHIATKHVRHHV